MRTAGPGTTVTLSRFSPWDGYPGSDHIFIEASAATESIGLSALRLHKSPGGPPKKPISLTPLYWFFFSKNFL